MPYVKWVGCLSSSLGIDSTWHKWLPSQMALPGSLVIFPMFLYMCRPNHSHFLRSSTLDALMSSVRKHIVTTNILLVTKAVNLAPLISGKYCKWNNKYLLMLVSGKIHFHHNMFQCYHPLTMDSSLFWLKDLCKWVEKSLWCVVSRGGSINFHRLYLDFGSLFWSENMHWNSLRNVVRNQYGHFNSEGEAFFVFAY